MATHSSIIAWRIPWTEEPGGLQSIELQRVGHDWVTFTFTFHKLLTVVCWGLQDLASVAPSSSPAGPILSSRHPHLHFISLCFPPLPTPSLLSFFTSSPLSIDISPNRPSVMLHLGTLCHCLLVVSFGWDPLPWEGGALPLSAPGPHHTGCMAKCAALRTPDYCRT